MEMAYRGLRDSEIQALTSSGCSAEDWGKVVVAEGFDTSLVSACRFEGSVRIGKNVTIKNVQASIANYIIEDNVTIRNIESLRTKGRSSFGNGTPVAVLNEAGGREVRIYDTITAQTAYVAAMYRHRTKTVKAINDLVDIYVSRAESDTGVIGKGSKILNCGTLKNVRIGEYAVIHGACDLRNGTVNSSFDAPTLIGWNVIARDFITAASVEITDGAAIEKCFVGQGSVIGKGFTAENSLFFANCQCFGGEAVSVFAGPYTVTHHKSTLLIGGMFSFYNAGSGTNQSNHYYRLGPLHQGVLERGVKTGSGSYLLFPARIGAFSLVKGRHNANIDTSQFPFSYIVESDEGSLVIPGANLVNVGTVRDAMKWPVRDNRKGTAFTDIVNYEMLTPYTISKVVSAIKILRDLGTSGKRHVVYGNVRIRCSSIETAIETYTTALEKYTGGLLAAKLGAGEWKSADDLADLINTGSRTDCREWADLAGFIAPVALIDKVLDEVDQRHCDSLEELQESFVRIHKSYRKQEWVYVMELMSALLGKDPSQITIKDLIRILERWKKCVAGIDTMLERDARKEFSDRVKTGYGIDGGSAAREADFESVRGRFEDNGFVKGLAQHTAKNIKTADRLISELKRL